jgi:hypothetical protein
MLLLPPRPAARVPRDGTLTVKTGPSLRPKPPAADSLRVPVNQKSKSACDRQTVLSPAQPIFPTLALLP